MLTLTAAQWVYCILVLLLAYGLRGSTGFGGAIGLPLLALVVPIKLLVPLWTLLGFTSSVAILGKDRQFIAVKLLPIFLPACLLGVVVGLYGFSQMDAEWLSRGLGALILLYGLQVLVSSFMKISSPLSQWPSLAPMVAFLSGVVGALFGSMATVFFAIFLDIKTLPKSAFRATISAMLLALCVFRGVGYWWTGEFSPEVWYGFAAALPIMLVGMWCGDRIHVRLSELSFQRIVGVVLLLCAVPLLLR